MVDEAHPAVLHRRHRGISNETYSQNMLGVMSRRCIKCKEGKPIRGGTMRNKKFICAGCLKKEKLNDDRVP